MLVVPQDETGLGRSETFNGVSCDEPEEGALWYFHFLIRWLAGLGMLVSYFWMSYTQMAAQIKVLRFSSLVFPTLDFHLIHVDFTIAMTVIFSLTMGFSRTFSFIVKMWSSIVSSVSSAGAKMKVLASQTHMLQQKKGKLSIGNLSGNAAKEKIREELEDGAMDRRVLKKEAPSGGGMEKTREQKNHKVQNYNKNVVVPVDNSIELPATEFDDLDLNDLDPDDLDLSGEIVFE